MSEKIANFRLVDYRILKSVLTIKDDAEVGKELDVAFADDKEVNEEGLIFSLQLESKIKDINNSLNIEVLIKGIFEFDKDINDRERDIFFNQSAPAILFPYIRAYVSSLTGLSGISPIILPTLNLSKRGEDKD